MDKTELLRLLSQDSKARRFKIGDIIVREGENAFEGIAFLLNGEAKVYQSQGDKKVNIGFIHAGQFFGETALVLSRPRMASVEATSSETIVLFISAVQFKIQANQNYYFLEMLMTHTVSRIEYVLAALSRLNANQEIMIDPTLFPIIEENRRQSLKLQDMLNHTRSAWIGNNKPVFMQGDRNDEQTFLVVKGTITIYREIEKKKYKMFSLSEGDIFGYSKKSSTPTRRYTACAEGDSARIISFDEELLHRLMRMNQELFYFIFRSMITQLVILDDALRMVSARLMHSPGESEAVILDGFIQSDYKNKEFNSVESKAKIAMNVDKSNDVDNETISI